MAERTATYAKMGESRGASFSGMFWDSLKPFPGRGRITLRLAIACTLIVLVADTFRMPMQDLLPFFVLFVTKEEKVTTAISALLVLFAITLAIAAAILLYKATGNREEFRIPGIALEIFIGMFLFRVLAIPAVGWILGFIVAAAQSLVYLSPDAEDTVHQFLWVWVAVTFSTAVAWLANVLLFPVSPVHVLRREFVTRWHAVSAATEQLTTSQPSAAAHLVRPLVIGGPIRILKLLKLSSIESSDLRAKQVELRRVILSLDKITRLIFSYAKARLISSASMPVASGETAVLGGLNKEAQSFQQEFEAGFVPSYTPTQLAMETAGEISPQLVEADKTLKDLATKNNEAENGPAKAPGARHKPGLFVADAFRNPRHVQFAIKVTLAGMIGYLFYTASDYYGIHTVFYTPLILALGSTGATMHKGFLRIVGCTIGGALGLICSIWVIPRFETLGTFLLIVFCVHGLAAWIAVGDDRISYMGLQIALAFDLGFLQGYGPPDKIDPLRDRFIGIVLGICIVTVVFAVIWPESADLSARERLAACLRAIARLLRVGKGNNGSQDRNTQREQLELEIASRLSEANSYDEQAAFEELISGSIPGDRPKLGQVIAATEEIYVCSLPWIRDQKIPDDGEPKSMPELTEQLPNVVEACADRVDQYHRRISDETPMESLIEKTDSVSTQNGGALQKLISAVVELQALLRVR
ncbi:MAG: FUSC family protein [Verrucomicrobia bacterium]|nr:FUSC family protein [Verrucomicrobiota bacterium]